ncbi:MAG: hypothetical protein NT029_13875 [Armatimonadetes bacterium]|nr:hypothetical protein [Armatimonadota bacterium]
MRLGHWAALAAALGAAAAGWAQGAISFGGAQAISLRLGGSSLMTLVRRPDVQRHLEVSMNQRAKLEETTVKPQAIRVSVQGGDGANQADTQRKIEDQIKAQLGDRDAKLKEVLRPEQYQRLVQLDRQWRGPLSLADADVAAAAGVGAEARSRIAAISGEYEREKQAVMMELAQKQKDASPDGSKRSVMIKMDTKQLENPLSPQYQKLDKAKRAAEARALACLTAEEKKGWEAAQGAPFTFRKDVPGVRF